MLKYLNRLSACKFSGNSQNLLKPFGIVNPNIVRNLSYSLLSTLEFLSIMSTVLTMCPLTQKPNKMNSLALAPSSPFLVPRPGIFFSHILVDPQVPKES